MVLIKVPKIKPCLSICEPNTSFVVDDVTIHVLNANHTPGSAMFLFVLKSGKKILFTGDFRAEPKVIEDTIPFAPIDNLFIDCTYASSGLKIPPRKACLDFIISKLKEYLPQGYTSIIGTYSIGKEDVVFDVADATAMLVYAPETRMKAFKDLMTAGYRKSELFTNDKSIAKIHVLSMMDTSAEGALNYARSSSIQKVVSFQLTGWSANPYWQSPNIFETNGIRIVSFSVPYSDHSSPDELISFVKAVQPVTVCSITDFTDKAKAKVQNMFLPYLRKSKNKSFIEFYASPPKKAKKIVDESQNFFTTDSEDVPANNL
ncbi:DNA repair metallo-beta-lactamase family protein [Histomonas meleagridis]|uniref:DNA repair metallo-beta-lactamase family protein n=1 Tax=Histomonas meleagridis TaxID=135588 RepID=UPI003559E69D|nr:DNA repair metallo-beta-lactamase family protein [Histomonas meleagridis]